MIPYDATTIAMHTSIFMGQVVWEGIFKVVNSSEMDSFKIFYLKPLNI